MIDHVSYDTLVLGKIVFGGLKEKGRWKEGHTS